MPPLSSCGNMLATSGRRPTHCRSSRTRSATSRLDNPYIVVLQRVSDLLFDPHDRIQRVHRALRNQGDLG